MRTRQPHARQLIFVSTLFTILLQLPVAAKDLPAEKGIFSYSRRQLKEVGRLVLGTKIEPHRVCSSGDGNALHFFADDLSSTKVAVVPLDPRDEVRVVTLPGHWSGKAFRKMERGLLSENADLQGWKEVSEPPPNPTKDAAKFPWNLEEEGVEVYPAGDRVYVFSNGGTSTTTKCQIFRVDGTNYECQSTFLIESPAGQHNGVMCVNDFDPDSGYLVLEDYFDLPAILRSKGLVFDLNKRDFIWKKRFSQGYGFLLRGDVLARFETPKSR